MLNTILNKLQVHLAHHPTCYRYDHHLIRIFQFDFCLGCSSATIGGIIGWLVHRQAQLEPTLYVFLSCFVLLIPTVIQPFFQRKWFKILSRTMLGSACAIYLLNVLGLATRNHYENFVSIGLLGLMFLIAKGLVKWRNDQTADPCDDCPHGEYPVCYHELQFETDEERILLLDELNQLQAVDLPVDCKRGRCGVRECGSSLNCGD
jgi:hypothetical protein